MNQLDQSLLALITETATNIPADVRRAIASANERERPGTRSMQALKIINRNIDMAHDSVQPVCQDTGMPTFVIHTPIGVNQLVIKKAIFGAVEEATRQGKLRPNSVDSITGKNSGLNLGPGSPVIHFEQWDQDEIEIKLLLKGGGCENKNIQYSLPADLEGMGRADRSLEGVYKCILHAAWQAQGQGCSQGFLGVCIGGDRTSGYSHAKEQLFRETDDTNENADLKKLEEQVMANVNSLGIGTMGFGGAVTLLGCKIGALNRLPASFFVSVAYNCWAYRRLGVRLNAETGAISRWLYKAENPTAMSSEPGFPKTGQEIPLSLPITEEQARSLKVGDVVMLSGPMHTGRDALHKYLMTNDSPVDMNGAALYHCGPVMLQDTDGKWHVKAAGPTTSAREEPYQAEVLRKFGVRIVIGKGGMGAKTSQGLQETGAVYLNAIGGAAQVYAENILNVDSVDFLDEFGIPEAMWHLQVKDFVAVVTMDSHGGSLHAEVERDSLAALKQLATK